MATATLYRVVLESPAPAPASNRANREYAEAIRLTKSARTTLRGARVVAGHIARNLGFRARVEAVR